jgi:hypothetical protein
VCAGIILELSFLEGFTGEEKKEGEDNANNATNTKKKR